MALGRKKGGGRKEPLFGLAAALADLRLSAADRIAAALQRDWEKVAEETFAVCEGVLEAARALR